MNQKNVIFQNLLQDTENKKWGKSSKRKVSFFYILQLNQKTPKNDGKFKFVNYKIILLKNLQKLYLLGINGHNDFLVVFTLIKLYRV